MRLQSEASTFPLTYLRRIGGRDSIYLDCVWHKKWGLENPYDPREGDGWVSGVMDGATGIGWLENRKGKANGGGQLAALPRQIVNGWMQWQRGFLETV